MIDTKELRRLAQAATPGGWYVEKGNYVYGYQDVTDGDEEWRPVIACTDDDEPINFEGNAAFIAAANPSAISELLDRLEAAEKECDNANAAAVGVALKAEMLEAERDALRSKSKGWQPIETAPKDGTKVLVTWAEEPLHIEVCEVGELGGWFYSYDGDSPKFDPTHWMPLPEAPTEKENPHD